MWYFIFVCFKRNRYFNFVEALMRPVIDHYMFKQEKSQ